MSSKTITINQVITDDSLSVLTGALIRSGFWLGIGTGNRLPLSTQRSLTAETTSMAVDANGNNSRVPAVLSQVTTDIYNDTFQAQADIIWDSTKSIYEVGLFSTNGVVNYSTGTVSASGSIIRSDQYDVGTVSVSGVTVTGAKTLWSSSFAVQPGYYIQFENSPARYLIASVNHDTSLTLMTSPGAIPAGSSYLISSTAWQTSGILPGYQIAFGSNPSPTWYTVTNIINDVSLTINGNITIAPGTPYLIKTGSGVPSGGVLYSIVNLNPALTFDQGDQITFMFNIQYPNAVGRVPSITSLTSTSTGSGFDSNVLSVINGSVSGSLSWCMCEQQTGHKRVIIGFDNLQSSPITINFPASFNFIPCIPGNSALITISQLTKDYVIIPDTSAAAIPDGTLIIEGI